MPHSDGHGYGNLQGLAGTGVSKLFFACWQSRAHEPGLWVCIRRSFDNIFLFTLSSATTTTTDRPLSSKVSKYFNLLELY
jgi:hypothetical protein